MLSALKLNNVAKVGQWLVTEFGAHHFYATNFAKIFDARAPAKVSFCSQF